MKHKFLDFVFSTTLAIYYTVMYDCSFRLKFVKIREKKIDLEDGIESDVSMRPLTREYYQCPEPALKL